MIEKKLRSIRTDEINRIDGWYSLIFFGSSGFFWVFDLHDAHIWLRYFFS